MAKRQVKITEQKLGREKALGLAIGDDDIRVDPRQDAKEYFDTIIHEGIHVVSPYLEEQEVVRMANSLANILWDCGYRKVILK